MGLGVVQSLARAGIAVHARDIRAEAQAAAVASGAVGCASAAAVARDCGIVIIVVVDEVPLALAARAAFAAAMAAGYGAEDDASLLRLRLGRRRPCRGERWTRRSTARLTIIGRTTCPGADAMEMKRLPGGNLRAAGYDERKRLLVVELTNGTFEYSGVTAETWRRFAGASSPWSFFRDNIEEDYPAKRVR